MGASGSENTATKTMSTHALLNFLLRLAPHPETKGNIFEYLWHLESEREAGFIA